MPYKTALRQSAMMLLVGATLAGCAGISQSRLNPMNWFGPRTATYSDISFEKPADKRALIETIVDMQIEKLPSGALVRATGRAATQGYWEADLVLQGLNDDGDLVIEFRAFPAAVGALVSTPRSREITAAVSLRADTLASARRIIVQGAQNAQSARP
jgi:hypothetical protein